MTAPYREKLPLRTEAHFREHAGRADIEKGKSCLNPTLLTCAKYSDTESGGLDGLPSEPPELFYFLPCAPARNTDRTSGNVRARLYSVSSSSCPLKDGPPKLCPPMFNGAVLVKVPAIG